MRLAIFGGTGRTGQHLVERALSAGHEVTILVRTPSKVEASRERLTILVGDVRNAERVEKAISGAEAVISVLGPTNNKPPYEVSAGTENIISA